MGNLVFPFQPGQSQQDKNRDGGGWGRPFMHLKGSPGAASVIRSLLPSGSTIEDKVWSDWVKDGGLSSAIVAWAKEDRFSEYADSPSGLVGAAVRKTLDQDPTATGRSFVVTVINHAIDETLLDTYVDHARGDEPSYVADSYEDWFGYTGEGGQAGAENYEDFWKAGGREGEAESEMHHEWESKGTRLFRAWKLACVCIREYIGNPDLAAQEEAKSEHQKRQLMAALQPYRIELNPQIESIVEVQAYFGRSASLDQALHAILKEKFFGVFHAKTFYDELLAFKDDPAQIRLPFRDSLKAVARKAVHEMARELGLQSESHGKPGKRHIEVFKTSCLVK